MIKEFVRFRKVIGHRCPVITSSVLGNEWIYYKDNTFWILYQW